MKKLLVIGTAAATAAAVLAPAVALAASWAA